MIYQLGYPDIQWKQISLLWSRTWAYIHSGWSSVCIAFCFAMFHLALIQLFSFMSSLVAQTVRHLPIMQEPWVRSLGQDDPLAKELATRSSTLAWKIPWMEEPGGLQSMGSQRVRHNWATLLSLSFLLYIKPSSFLLGITTAKYGYERHVLNVYVLKTKLKWLWITCFKCLCSISLIIELFVGRKWLGVEVGEGDWRRKKSYRRVIPERKSKNSPNLYIRSQWWTSLLTKINYGPEANIQHNTTEKWLGLSFYLDRGRIRHMSSTWRTTGIPHPISGGKSSFDLKEKDENRDHLGLWRLRLLPRAHHLLSFSRTEHAYHLWG